MSSSGDFPNCPGMTTASVLTSTRRGFVTGVQPPELTVWLLERSDNFKLCVVCVSLTLRLVFKKPSLCFVIHPFNLKSLQP